jgi:hypothetical protein
MSERNFAAFTWVWGCFLGLVAGLSIGYRTGTLNMKRWQDAYYRENWEPKMILACPGDTQWRIRVIGKNGKEYCPPEIQQWRRM